MAAGARERFVEAPLAAHQVDDGLLHRRGRGMTDDITPNGGAGRAAAQRFVHRPEYLEGLALVASGHHDRDLRELADLCHGLGRSRDDGSFTRSAPSSCTGTGTPGEALDPLGLLLRGRDRDVNLGEHDGAEILGLLADCSEGLQGRFLVTAADLDVDADGISADREACLHAVQQRRPAGSSSFTPVDPLTRTMRPISGAMRSA